MKNHSNNSIAAEYGVGADAAGPQGAPTNAPHKHVGARGKIPSAAMHPSVQFNCDQKAHIFASVARMKYSFKANDKRNKLAVLKLASKNARPLRSRGSSGKKQLQSKYRPSFSDDLLRVLDWILGAYTPDRNGNLKYASYIDEVGRLRFETAKKSRQLEIPVRTLQRLLAKLRAMRLIDSTQAPRHDRNGEYSGSDTLVTPRADVYMNFLNEVLIQRSIDRASELAWELFLP